MRVFTLAAPRHACGPRDVVRAGELWRLVQEATVQDSAARGWPPSRYRAEQRAFVVRSLFGRHHAELPWGTPVLAETWVSTRGRAVVFERRTELRGAAADGAATPLLSAEVGWAHLHGGRPSRAPTELIAALGHGREERLAPVEVAADGPGERLFAWTFTPIFADTDPLGHVNHCRFVDWADEVIFQWLAARGVEPHGVRPCTDSLRFLAPSPPGSRLTAVLTRLAVLDDRACFGVRFTTDDDHAVVEAILERSHATEPTALWRP